MHALLTHNIQILLESSFFVCVPEGFYKNKKKKNVYIYTSESDIDTRIVFRTTCSLVVGKLFPRMLGFSKDDIV